MKKPAWEALLQFLKGSDGLQRKTDLQQLPSRYQQQNSLPVGHYQSQKSILFSGTHEATSQWLTEMENRFQIYLLWESSIFLRNNELWGHRRFVLFPTYRDNLILEEKVTNEQDILIPVMCFCHFNVSWTTKMFVFLSSLFLRAQEERCHWRGKNWVTPAPSTQLPKKQSKMQLWIQPACIFTVVGGASPLTNRVHTKQHFPQCLVVRHKADNVIQNPGQSTRWREVRYAKTRNYLSKPSNKQTTTLPLQIHRYHLCASYDTDTVKTPQRRTFSFNPCNSLLKSHN